MMKVCFPLVAVVALLLAGSAFTVVAGNPVLPVDVVVANSTAAIHPLVMDETVARAAAFAPNDDDDSDGVLNKYDQCSGTPRGVEVNSIGCPYPI